MQGSDNMSQPIPIMKVRKAFMNGIARMAFEEGFKKGFGKCNELTKKGKTEHERLSTMKKFRIFSGSKKHNELLFKQKPQTARHKKSS